MVKFWIIDSPVINVDLSLVHTARTGVRELRDLVCCVCTLQPISRSMRRKARLCAWPTRQWCIAGSAPDTPCTMDSSSLGARRRLGLDTTNTTQQGR